MLTLQNILALVAGACGLVALTGHEHSTILLAIAVIILAVAHLVAPRV